MLRSWRGTGVLFGLIGILIVPAQLFAEDHDEIPLTKVPAVVRQGALKALPDAKWSKAFKSTEDDETVYELVGEDGKGRELTVELTPTGKVLEIETGLPIAEVPQLVLDVLKVKAKDLRIERARAVSQEGKVIAYSFNGQSAKGQSIAVRISADGKAVEIEMDME